MGSIPDDDPLLDKIVSILPSTQTCHCAAAGAAYGIDESLELAGYHPSPICACERWTVLGCREPVCGLAFRPARCDLGNGDGVVGVGA